MSPDSKQSLCNDIEQRLLEVIGDFLSEEDIQRWEVLYGFHDPLPADQTELHIQMAKAAMSVYAQTIVQIPARI